VSLTLITGATGFIGSHVARLLAARGDELRATVRAKSRTDALDDLHIDKVTADILDRRAIRRAMQGVDRLFHVAGTTSLTMPRRRVFAINVEGTRIVLEEALRAKVQRVVYTSSVAAIGPAPQHSTADETQVFDAGRYQIPYVDSKHEAEVEVLRMVARGLPVVIVNPAHVMGAGDPGRSSTALVKRFLARRIPVYVDGTLNIVGVQDVARGHLLADERGSVGERYILGNRNFTLDRLLADLARLSGVEPPAIKLPVTLALALARAVQSLPVGQAQAVPLPLPLPPLGVPVSVPSPVEVRAVSLNWAFRNIKAKRELGWTTSPHEDCLEETIAWYRERHGDRLSPPGARQPIVLRLAGGVIRRASRLPL
jgi:dihydroflavonol-4-reductase